MRISLMSSTLLTSRQYRLPICTPTRLPYFSWSSLKPSQILVNFPSCGEDPNTGTPLGPGSRLPRVNRPSFNPNMPFNRDMVSLLPAARRTLCSDLLFKLEFLSPEERGLCPSLKNPFSNRDGFLPGAVLLPNAPEAAIK